VKLPTRSYQKPKLDIYIAIFEDRMEEIYRRVPLGLNDELIRYFCSKFKVTGIFQNTFWAISSRIEALCVGISHKCLIGQR